MYRCIDGMYMPLTVSLTKKNAHHYVMTLQQLKGVIFVECLSTNQSQSLLFLIKITWINVYQQQHIIDYR